MFLNLICILVILYLGLNIGRMAFGYGMVPASSVSGRMAAASILFEVRGCFCSPFLTNLCQSSLAFSAVALPNTGLPDGAFAWLMNEKNMMEYNLSV